MFGIKKFLGAAALAAFLAPQLGICQSLKIVTYNIWGLPSPLIRHPERFDRLARAIDSIDADIVLIQEAFTKKARALLALKNFPYHAWGPEGGFLRLSSGLLILSKHPILETKTLRYSQCGGFDCFANKGALYARIRLPNGQMIGVFDTHLNANGHTSVRYHQAAELIGFVHRNSFGLPVVLGGDFNGDKRPFIETFSRTLDARNVHAEFVESHPDLTEEARNGYTADPHRNPFLKRSDPSYRLDHVFLVDGTEEGDRAPSRKENWRVLNDEVIFNGRDTQVLSDHLGVKVSVDLAPAASG